MSFGLDECDSYTASSLQNSLQTVPIVQTFIYFLVLFFFLESQTLYSKGQQSNLSYICTVQEQRLGLCGQWFNPG